MKDPIEPSLQVKFKTEQLSRIIKECNDIDIIKDIAMELLKLNQSKTAIADWATKKVLEAYNSKLNQDGV